MAPMDMALVALVSCLSIPAPAAAFGPARPPPTPPTPPLVGFSLTPFANCSEGGVDDGSSICYESDEESKLTVLKTLNPAVCKHTLLRPGNCTLYAYPKAKGTVIGLDVQKYTQSSGGHLWFYSVNPEYRPPQCGEVDAGLRIPAELFEAKNKAALDLYSKVTLAGYGGPGLTLGRCSDTFYPPNCNDACAKGSSHRCRDCENGPDTPFSTYSGGLRNVPWMTPDIGLSCKKLCNCSVTSAFDPCMDVPDDPGRGRFCSLCGPKYTRAITLTLYVQPQPPAPPPAPECNPDKGCTVCAACCQAYIKDGNDCNACVQQTCANNTIADIAIATPDLTTLVAALKAWRLCPLISKFLTLSVYVKYSRFTCVFFHANTVTYRKCCSN